MNASQTSVPVPSSTLIFILHEIRRIPLSADYSSSFIPHVSPLLAAVTHGRVRISDGESSRIVQAGSLIMLPNSESIRLTALNASSAIVDLIHFSKLSDVKSDDQKDELWASWHTPLPRLIRNLSPLHRSLASADRLQQLERHIAFSQFMLFALQHRKSSSIPAANRLQAVEQAALRLQSEYHLEPPTLDELATEAGMSKRHFTALFRQLTHNSVNAYITALRIGQAKRLLMKGERLADVAQSVGYRDEFYFIRRFKQAVGQTPRQYALAQMRRLQIFIPSGKPQRVIADQYLGHLLKLGIFPVGVRTQMLDGQYLGQRRLETCLHRGVSDLGPGFPLCLQQVSQLKPDLIITQNEQQFAELQTIAPTVLMPYSGIDPLEKLRIFSRMFDSTTIAERWISLYSERLETVRLQMSQQLEQCGAVTNLLLLFGKLYVLGPSAGYGSYSLYRALHLPLPGRTVHELNETMLSKSISLDDLPDYAGHSLFVTCHDDPKPLFASAVWKSLPAVRNKRVFRFNPYRFAFEDPDSLDHQLDDLIKMLSFS